LPVFGKELPGIGVAGRLLLLWSLRNSAPATLLSFRLLLRIRASGFNPAVMKALGGLVLHRFHLASLDLAPSSRGLFIELGNRMGIGADLVLWLGAMNLVTLCAVVLAITRRSGG
jgi:hypothetical protein